MFPVCRRASIKPSSWMSPLYLLGVYCLFVSTFNYASTDISVLDLTDRGSVTDTPHVVPNKHWLLEGGYQQFSFNMGSPISAIPQAEIVRGLNYNTEVFVILPSYYSQKTPPLSGNDTPLLGTKHELIHGNKWLVSLQGIVVLPGGSFEFGHQSTGGQLNAMAVYDISPQFDLSGMLGVSTVSQPNLLGGGRFYSFNPSIALSYSPIETLDIFIELFDQTKTDTFGGYVFAADCGLNYQIAKNTSLDFEFGQKLIHNQLSFTHYLGGGITAVF